MMIGYGPLHRDQIFRAKSFIGLLDCAIARVPEIFTGEGGSGATDSNAEEGANADPVFLSQLYAPRRGNEKENVDKMTGPFDVYLLTRIIALFSFKPFAELHESLIDLALSLLDLVAEGPAERFSDLVSHMFQNFNSF
ncbi:hypothetical protein HK097_003978 [Rhizophlyctis rosea]|uniref:Uncharacterized protein n=1 Tax=Rhizophlyctis rosea TaxID=64517 RepID=A0AAD5SF46_9FUNG|nr:hypothetical protein HK097_003978 [Rhizophlyctis rosea]